MKNLLRSCVSALMLIVILTNGLAFGDIYSVSSRATGGFGYRAVGWQDMIEVGAFSEGDLLLIETNGTINIGPSTPTGPDGIDIPVDGYHADQETRMPLEEKEVDAGTFPIPRPDPVPNVGASMGAFIPVAIADSVNFIPRDDDYTGVGNGISSEWLFFVGQGLVVLTVPYDCKLYIGTNDEWASNNSGEFVVEVTRTSLGNLIGLDIVGPNEAAENSTIQYAAMAYFDDGQAFEVTNKAVWSVEPTALASIDDEGRLTTQQIHDLEELVTITAHYTSGGTTVAGQKPVSIYSICPSGSALDFDGQNDYAKLPNSVIVPNAEAKSIGLWFKVNSWRRWNRLFMWWDGTNKTVVCLGEHEGQLGGALNNNSADGFHTNTLFSVEEWHHVCYAFDGSTIKAYFDGQEISDLRWDDWYVNDQGVYIGARPGISNQYFDGEIDEVQVWSKALTAQEIQLYMHRRPDGNEPNLVGYWDFDEGDGQIVHDTSVNANNGQLGSDPNADDNDPNWVDSDAPVGTCTLEGLVERDLSGVFDAKLNILQELDEAMAQENIVLDMLNTHFKNRDFGTASKNDVVKAKQRIHTAIQHEIQAETDVHKSLNSLEEALDALDSDVQPHIQPQDPVLNAAIQADINGDRIINMYDFLILSDNWLKSYQIPQ